MSQGTDTEVIGHSAVSCARRIYTAGVCITPKEED